MARRKDNTENEDILQNGEIEVQDTETVIEKEVTEEVVSEEQITDIQHSFLKSNSDCKFLYFDLRGGVYSPSAPKELVKNCKKINNPYYGIK